MDRGGGGGGGQAKHHCLCLGVVDHHAPLPRYPLQLLEGSFEVKAAGGQQHQVIHVEEHQHAEQLLRGGVYNLATDTEGHFEAVHAFGLACLNDLAGQEVHEDVEQKGGEGAALPYQCVCSIETRKDCSPPSLHLPQ